MLNNLRAELVRKGLTPTDAVAHAINCSIRTAKNKLDEKSDITVPEAVTIMEKYFVNDNFSIEYLFKN